MSRRIFTPELEFEVNPDLLDEGITQSEMQCWDNCAEKWYLGYNLMLHRVGKFAWPLTYGSWIHGALHEFYVSKGKRWTLNTKVEGKQFFSLETLAKEDYWRGVAEVQMAIYASHFKRDFQIMDPVAVEEIVDIVFEGVRLKGMIDVYARDLTIKRKDEFLVWDHKTTYKIDKSVVMGWDFRFQFMFYCWMATKVKKWKKFPNAGFFINAIRKPALKQGVNESLDSFLQRLQTDMQDRPESYFYRDKLHLKQGDLDHFERTILAPKIARIKLLFDPKVQDQVKMLILRNKNTDYCISKFGSVCEFLPACQHGLELEHAQYRKREVKHMELLTETPE